MSRPHAAKSRAWCPSWPVAPPPRPAKAKPLPPAPPLPSTGDEGLDAALTRLRDAVRAKGKR